MTTNQKGEPIAEQIYGAWNIGELTHEELAQVVCMLADSLNLQIVRTNATKHGNTELQLQDVVL